MSKIDDSVESFVRAAIDYLGDGINWQGYSIGLESHRLDPTIPGVIRILVWDKTTRDAWQPTTAEFELSLKKVK